MGVQGDCHEDSLHDGEARRTNTNSQRQKNKTTKPILQAVKIKYLVTQGGNCCKQTKCKER